MIFLMLGLFIGNAYFFQSHFDACESMSDKHKSCNMYYEDKFILDDQKLDE